MADTTGGEIPSLDSSKDAMCDSQSDVESTAATNGTSSGGTSAIAEAGLDSSPSEPTSMGAPSPSSTTVDSSISSCGNSLEEAKKVASDDKPSPQSSSSSSSSPLPSSFSVCSPLVTASRSPLFAVAAQSSRHNNFSRCSPSSVAAVQSSSCSPLRPAPPRPSRPLVLRPSQLGGGVESGARVNSPFVLKAPKLLSPFSSAKGDEPEEQNSAEAEPLCAPEKDTTSDAVSSNVQETCSSTDNQITSSSSPTRPPVSAASSSVSPLPSSSSSSSSSAAPPAPPPQMSFVPLGAPKVAAAESGATQVAATPSGATTAASSNCHRFVFGQNLHERVIVESSTLDTAASCASESVSVSNNGEASCSSATTNGTSEMLFSSVIQKELPDKSAENSVDDKNRKSLSEAAREYEESRAIKRKYEEVAVVTGEEEENNILQMDCKLFVYDNNKLNYSEGVHGMLRVNDPPSSAKKATGQSSRVIVRMSGSLRVLLNTKIWADMKIEKPNRKIVRMTAMDTNGQIKIFLISSSPSESEMLFRVLDARIKQQKEVAVNCQNGNGSDNKTDAEECTSSSPS
ncbi:hypothetical protein LSTR_LSTR007095 [Laodelphax striatellus]|uniref:RanBD1 domain-containing protein n=1 Tax=Laodelphax striatellus TaxID=195883 RepID=A0A482WEU1_LAOST|nr:hypothetical protein LSTR_LSTR007095 [Laodelphax striatellus]